MSARRKRQRRDRISASRRVLRTTNTDPPPRGRGVESPRQPVPPPPPVSGFSRTSTLPVQGCLPGIRDPEI